MKTIRRKLHKPIIIAIMTIPVIGTIAFMIHCALLISKVELFFSEWTFGLSVAWLIMVYLYSWEFRFSSLHRGFILYCFLMHSCIMFQRCHGFGSYLLGARLFMLILGFSLLAFLYKQRKTFFSTMPTYIIDVRKELINGIHESLADANHELPRELETKINRRIEELLENSGIVSQMVSFSDRLADLEDEQSHARHRKIVHINSSLPSHKGKKAHYS